MDAHDSAKLGNEQNSVLTATFSECPYDAHGLEHKDVIIHNNNTYIIITLLF